MLNHLTIIHDHQRKLAAAGLLLGAMALALEPAMWLAGTWYQDGYDGVGWIACALVVGLSAWSLNSPLSPLAGPAKPLACTYTLLLVTAAIRLLAQLLDVNVVGALLLCVDVFALARLARLHRRARAISPFWLAVLFCFSLPVEPIVQRLIGYDLQQMSAQFACVLLMPFFTELNCAGVRLQVNGLDVLVDLPCSGAQLMSLCALVCAFINVLLRPNARWGAAGALVCVALALLGNAVRIALLAIGIVYQDELGFAVMDAVPHTVIGLIVVSSTCAGLLCFTRLYTQPAAQPLLPCYPRFLPQSRLLDGPRSLWFASLFVPMALLIGAVQPQPVDASASLPPPEIPLVAAGFLRQPSALSEQEQSYFTRYGGGAARASFGPYGLLVVTTASPLRHLHDPTICLSGMGYRVRLLGTDHLTNSTVYSAHSRTEGAAPGYLVRVSYLSDQGQIASSVSQAVWHWLRQPDSRWTMVQRIVPDDPGVDPEATMLWEHAMRRAFNLS